MDPRLLRALQLSQFSVQYLLSSQKVMKEKENTIRSAVHTFQQEEDLLDVKIAKMK